MNKIDMMSFLAGFSNQPVLYLPNPGNAGDAIIAHATYQVFEKAGLKYRVIDRDISVEETAGKVVIYGGGGNLVAPYRNAHNFLLKHHRGAKRLIILPHTILSYPELVEQFSEDVDVFCREMESLKYVRASGTKANVYLADDMALSMDVTETFSQANKRFLPVFSSSGLISRNGKRIVRQLMHKVRNFSHGKCLYAFRDDVERTEIKIPKANIDISQAFCGDGMTEYLTHETAFRVLQFIDRFDVVFTNRLHVCISALLLGKKVRFYDNSYGKNKFLYECSLKGRFGNLLWEGESLEIGR